jgi:hypothetical protein
MGKDRVAAPGIVVRVIVALARAAQVGQVGLGRTRATGLRSRRKSPGPYVEGARAIGDDGAEDINKAAVAAYRASIDGGKPLSERKLAAMFGKTSRRWARNRIAEADDSSDASAPTHR